MFLGILPYVLRASVMEQSARDLVRSVLPLNFLSLVEYLLKSPHLPNFLQQVPGIAWVRSAPHVGRAMLWFGHPNVLASFLVLVLGLGLGLVLKQSFAPTPGGKLLLLATFANLIGIFATGSRNGLIVAIAQLLLFSVCVRPNRVWRWIGLAGLGAIALATAILGIGGRSLAVNTWGNDPRTMVWQFALSLVAQRPWLGWGLGNYKLVYPPGLIPGYNFVAHPHNFWLLLAVEAGIPVMILFTLWVGWICYRGVRLLLSSSLKYEQQSVLLGYCFAFFGCIGFGLFDVTFYDVRVNLLNWMLLGGIYTVTLKAMAQEQD